MSIEVIGGGDVTRNTFIQIQFDQVTSSSTEITFENLSGSSLPDNIIQLALEYYDCTTYDFCYWKWRFSVSVERPIRNNKMLYGLFYDYNYNGAQAAISITSDISSITISNLTLNNGTAKAFPSSTSKDYCSLWVYGYTYK